MHYTSGCYPSTWTFANASASGKHLMLLSVLWAEGEAIREQLLGNFIVKPPSLYTECVMFLGLHSEDMKLSAFYSSFAPKFHTISFSLLQAVLRERE